MTAIFGYTDGEDVWIAGDGRALLGQCEPTPTNYKVQSWFGGRLVLAHAGTYRGLNLIRRVGALSAEPGHRDNLEEWVAIIAREAREMFRAQGIVKTKDGADEDSGSRFMLGYASRLFVISFDFTVFEAQGSASLGCGGVIVDAAFRAMPTMPLPARLLRALEIAAELDVHVGPPYTVLKAKRLSPDPGERPMPG